MTHDEDDPAVTANTPEPLAKTMPLQPDIVDRAFRLFLGRSPAPDSLSRFADMGQLIHTLIKSKEHRNSGRSRKSGIPWPLNQVFVVPEAKLIYCPIGKNGCTFFKNQMVRLSSVLDKDFLHINVHFFTDNVNTGLQLSDYSREEAEAMISAPDFMKFAILRDPADRLLSAWLEKFVRNRHAVPNQHHTGPVVAAIQGRSDPDFHASVSFADFVHYVTLSDPTRLDPHWRPQHLYLEGMDYTHFFRFERMNEAVDAIEAWSGVELPRERINKTDYDGGKLQFDRAAELLPMHLDQMAPIEKACFLPEDLRGKILEAYARDYELIERV